MVIPTRIDITVPLVDSYLTENASAKEFIEELLDEGKEFEVHVYVSALDMVPTALALSMSKRINVSYHAHVSQFPGCEYIIGYLKSGYFKEVEIL
jgi:hypothetical protein